MVVVAVVAVVVVTPGDVFSGHTFPAAKAKQRGALSDLQGPLPNGQSRSSQFRSWPVAILARKHIAKATKRTALWEGREEGEERKMPIDADGAPAMQRAASAGVRCVLVVMTDAEETGGDDGRTAVWSTCPVWSCVTETSSAREMFLFFSRFVRYIHTTIFPIA